MVVIHIGWARAGSTALRRNFLERHPEITTVGRIQHGDGPAPTALRSIKSLTPAEFALAAPRLQAAWRQFIQATPSRVVCLSDEELSIGLRNSAVTSVEIGKRCGRVSPNARVLAVVRDQVDAIRSLYGLAQTRQPSALPLSDWTQRFFLAPRKDEDFTRLFCYAQTLQAYLEWCDRSSILAIPYDTLRGNAIETYRSICRWLGMADKECELFPTDIVNASPLLRMPPSEETGPPAADAEPGPDEFSAGQAAAIRARFADDNAKLSREFGVAL